MKTTNRILLLALFAALSALGLQAQSAGTSSTSTGGITGATNPGRGGNTTTGGSTSASGNTTTGGTTTPPTPIVPKGRGPAENASETAKTVHKVIADFQAQRDQYLTERKTLLEKLKSATEAERKTILEQLRAENEQRADEERALGKQIREELKKLREERKTGGS